MYVIKRQHEALTLWLVSIEPQRWGERDHALRFDGRGNARRAAVVIKLSGDWSIDVAGPSPPSAC